MKAGGLLLSTALTLCLVSCGTSYYGGTRYANADIKLGDSKEIILSKYGKPYIQELELVDGKTVETLGYKENMYYGYVMNTYFVFENGKLVRKVQEEEKPFTATEVNKK